MTQKELLQVLSRFQQDKQDEFGIVRMGIFGSAAHGRMTEESDVDVVVELSRPDLFALIGIKQELEELLQCPVDVLRYRETMNPFLKKRIEQDAIYV